MSNITVSEIRTYSQKNGDVTDYTQSCGWDGSSGNRVMRMTFTTDANGASSIDWKISYFYPWDWQNGNYASTPIPLNFYVGTDPDSHKVSGADETLITGAVDIHLDSGWAPANCYLAGSAEVSLAPNTTYYLWIFPAQAMNYVYVSGYAGQNVINSVELSASGLYGTVAYIKVSEQFVSAVPYIKINGEWRQVIPYILKDGTWKQL